jgi:hypothetical protein
MSKETINNEKGHGKPVLPLVINGKEHEWTEQYITGEQVRNLGNIQKEEEIFLSIRKPWEDEHILDETRIDLARPGIEHFYSKRRAVVIIVNGREKAWHGEKISYSEVVKLAFPEHVEDEKTVYTVTYKHGPHQNPQGSMVKGDSVFVKQKMVFNVTPTTRS